MHLQQLVHLQLQLQLIPLACSCSGLHRKEQLKMQEVLPLAWLPS